MVSTLSSEISEGLGTYPPKIGLDGTFDVSQWLDKAIKNAFNAPGAFSGQIVNRGNIPLLDQARMG